jgi:polar amino acid transport system permease protein
MLRARDLASSEFLPMHLFLLAALMYFAMSYPISLVVRRLEARLSYGHSGAA